MVFHGHGIEQEHKVLKRAFDTFCDPESHESGIPHEPNLPTKKEGTQAEGFFQIKPTWERVVGKYAGWTSASATLPRHADIAGVIVNDSATDGSVVVQILQPSDLLEDLIKEKRKNNMAYSNSTFDNSSTASDLWFLNTTTSDWTKLYRPMGFGAIQDEVWAWCNNSGAIPWQWNASDVPFGAYISDTLHTTSPDTEMNFQSVRKNMMWEVTHTFRLTSPISPFPNFDPSQFQPPVYKDGIAQAYAYKCSVTGKITTERYTRIDQSHLDLQVPGHWITFSPSYFSGRTKFCSLDIGLTILDMRAIENGGTGVGSSEQRALANKAIDNFGRAYSANVGINQYSVLGVLQSIYGVRTPVPLFRLVAGVTEIQSQDQNYNTGIIVPFSDHSGGDVRNYSPTEILKGGYHEYPITTTPVRTHYVPSTLEDVKFYPFGTRGSGQTAYAGFLIVGACTGHVGAPSVAVTPLPRNFRFRHFGKVESFDQRNGHNRDRHCSNFLACASTFKDVIGNTPDGARMAGHSPETKKDSGAVVIASHAAGQLPSPVASTVKEVHVVPVDTPPVKESSGFVDELKAGIEKTKEIGKAAAATLGSVVGAYEGAVTRGRRRTAAGAASKRRSTSVRARGAQVSASRTSSGSKSKRSIKQLWM